MRVLGNIKSDIYICEVSHKEIEKFLNQYYNKMSYLKTGDEIDLGKGYNFKQDTAAALVKTREFIEANKTIIESIINGITVMAREESEVIE